MHIFILLLPGVLCQIEMRPDVRFDEHNDRFDVSPLFDPGEYADKEDFRRSGDNSLFSQDLDLVHPELETPQKPNYSNDRITANQLFNILRQIRRSGSQQDSFAWHDDMRSAEEEQNFERNLEQFRSHDYRKTLVDYLHDGHPDGKPQTRRSAVDSDKEVLMHHALPISMKMKGYLQVPAVS